jgi:heptosyltransferase-3
MVWSGYDAGFLPTMELQNIRRLAVFKLRNIGDVLMLTPLLRALRETFPEARITAVVNSGTEAMLAHNPHLDEVLIYQRDSSWWNEIRFLRELRRRKFDLTIGFTEGQRTAWYSLLCVARYRFGLLKGKKVRKPWAYNFPMFPVREILHEVEKHFVVLGNAGLKLRDSKPGNLCLVVPDDVRAWASDQFAALRPARVIHLHPVSRWLWKCWGNEAMAAVIDWLHSERNARVVVTTGPAQAERDKARAIIRLCRTSPLFFDGNLSLGQIAALSAESEGYFGVDTAPMHMAAAVGVPVLALFGPTNPANWGPWTPLGRVLATPCRCNQPAATEKCDWTRTRACLAAISVTEVQAALDEMLAMRKISPASAV